MIRIHGVSLVDHPCSSLAAYGPADEWGTLSLMIGSEGYIIQQYAGTVSLHFHRYTKEGTYNALLLMSCSGGEMGCIDAGGIVLLVLSWYKKAFARGVNETNTDCFYTGRVSHHYGLVPVWMSGRSAVLQSLHHTMGYRTSTTPTTKSSRNLSSIVVVAAI